MIQFYCPHHAPADRVKIANSGTEKATCVACGDYGYTPAPYGEGIEVADTYGCACLIDADGTWIREDGLS